MTRFIKFRKDCLPAEVIRHLEQQGLGWGHDLNAGCFVMKTEDA